MLLRRPGFGPLITIPITEIAVQEPELEEALELAVWVAQRAHK